MVATRRTRTSTNDITPSDDIQQELDNVDLIDKSNSDVDEDYTIPEISNSLKIDNDDDDDDDYKEDINDDDNTNDKITSRKRTRGESNTIDNSEDEEEQVKDEEFSKSRSGSISDTQSSSINNNNNKKHHPGPVDKNGKPYELENEEYLLPEDSEGELKITKDGDLLNDRKFLVRSFTVLGKGEKKFMLSTEPARAVGIRDSNLFFQSHPNLYKFVISQEEKNDLINRSVLPYSYRSRLITLVTARSIFREFGAKIIFNGKNITDDYYATKLRKENTVIEGTLAREPKGGKQNISSKYLQQLQATNTNITTSQLPSINPAKNTVEFFDRRYSHNYSNSPMISSNMTQNTGKTLNSTNWLYQNAAASSRFNSDMYYDRVRILLIEQQGLRDPYTNVLHLPQSTQSTKVISYNQVQDNKLKNDKKYSVINEIKIKDSDLTKCYTGLSEIPKEVYEGCVSDELKKQIEEQIKYEKGL